MNCIVSSGALNSTHSLTRLRFWIQCKKISSETKTKDTIDAIKAKTMSTRTPALDFSKLIFNVP